VRFFAKVIVAVLAGLELAWLFRFDVVPASTEDHSRAYQLDRWTGAVYLLGAAEDGRVRLPDK
jgi:hypothetical protein